jgi:hypothetical protein
MSASAEAKAIIDRALEDTLPDGCQRREWDSSRRLIGDAF